MRPLQGDKFAFRKSAKSACLFDHKTIINNPPSTINNHPHSCHAVSIPLVAQHYGVPNETFTR
jgi:hypothetical protein